MSNETSQAATSPASEEAKPAEQAAQKASVQEQAQKEATPNLEEYRKIAREEATRIAQSQVAKGENRINQRIQEQFKALDMNQKVLGLSDKQVAEARKEIVANAYIEDEPEQKANPPAQPESKTHPAVQRAYAFMEKKKTIVEESDPEFEKHIKSILTSGPNIDEDELLLATAEAVKEKNARLASDKEKAPVRAAQSGTGTAVDPNDISKITDSRELYILGDQRMREGKTKK